MEDQTRFPSRLFWQLKLMEEDFTDDANDVYLPSYCVEIPRILLTPTRVAVVGFDVEMSNRVVRKFVEEEGFSAESFCRVSFGDENGDKLFSSELTDSVSDRIKTVLLTGIQINGLFYRFLAYSSSQLKENSLWMVRTERNWTVAKMRQWMGDFSMCKTPSKYAARMGQCFSTTFQAEEAVKGKKTMYHDERRLLNVFDDFPDVTITRNGTEKCHSDGTGLIDKSILKSLVERLPFAPSFSESVSIIQIRFGGAKGTLTAWDFQKLNGVPSGYDVLLRPSMVKFRAPYRHLEVVKVGTHVPYYLNRHVILLLQVHNVGVTTFLDMQQSMLSDLDRMLVDADQAKRLLPRLGGADSSLTSTLMHMLHSGLSASDDPFLFSCVHSIRSHHVTQLRKKARIFVRDGAVLMGGLDETGLLPEGCVFVQLRRSRISSDRNQLIKDDSFETLVGPVLVTKHPALHPGDVRMLLAIDIPELRDHKNMLLFSQQGRERPEADKMSGSDLDGDEFAVTWDPRLFLKEWNCCSQRGPLEWISRQGNVLSLLDNNKVGADAILQFEKVNHPPGEYDAATGAQKPVDDAFSDEQLVQYMIYHAKNDNLGWIATLWLDYACRSGADCENCLELAGLHSIAVDFPKSGIPATVPKELIIPRSVSRAHWRELSDREAYHDLGVIGQLYDQVAKTELRLKHIALVGRKYDKHGQVMCYASGLSEKLEGIYRPEIASKLGLNISENSSADSDLLRFAGEQRRDYDNRVFALMNKYKLYSEGEILTGLMRKYHRLNKRRRHDVSEEVRRCSRELRKAFRVSFFLKVWELVNGVGGGQGLIDLAGQESGFVNQETLPSSAERLSDTETISEESIDLIVEKLTKLILSTDSSASRTTDGGEVYRVQSFARKLAAAYYVATYSPEIRRRHLGHSGDEQALFSFPWIVADVISCGMNLYSP